MDFKISSPLPTHSSLTVSKETVHVWCASLKTTLSHRQYLAHTLTPDELVRAERFVFRKDREHFIAARGLLRVILARYLKAEPGDLSFCYSAYGKPALAKNSGGDTLRFNLSHSDGVALYAISCEQEVGVDLERIREDMDYEQIAGQFFSTYEFEVLRTLPEKKKREAFFNCWTRKEAYIKARGEGLSLPLDHFDVSLIPGEPAKLLGHRIEPQEIERWSLKSLTPAFGYAAALALERPSSRIECWRWTW
jgi:4'-phosphopantetheinyl transferase